MVQHMIEERRRKIFIADDDALLVERALEELFMRYTQERKILTPTYDVCTIDLFEVLNGPYWHSLNITEGDTVVLDFHYNPVNKQTTQQGKVYDLTKKSTPSPSGFVYNAVTIVEFLAEQKQKGFLERLERTVIWTSDNSKMKEPSFRMAEGFDVYGVIKGEDLRGKTTAPEEGLVHYLDAIYDDPLQHEIRPLNYGWRTYADKKPENDF